MFPPKKKKSNVVPPAGKPPHPRGAKTTEQQKAMFAGAPVGGAVPGAPMINGSIPQLKNGGFVNCAGSAKHYGK